MLVIKSYINYFQTVSEYNRAPPWQKNLLLRGTLLQKCNDAEPVNIRRRLRCFWAKEAAKQGLKIDQLKTWV